MAKSKKAADKAKATPASETGVQGEMKPVRENAWEGFEGGLWAKEVNVRDFIHRNYTPYLGDCSFLAAATVAVA